MADEEDAVEESEGKSEEKDKKDKKDKKGKGARTMMEMVTKQLGVYKKEADAVATRYPRIYTGNIDLDLVFRPTIGEVIEIVGPDKGGKTALVYILIGSLQRTCRRCYTPIIPFTDEDGTVKTTCRCGKNEGCRVLMLDLENKFDEVWSARLGVNTDGMKRTVDAPYIFNTDQSFCVVWPTYGSVGLDMALNLIRTGAVDAVVVDSITEVVSSKTIDNSVDAPKMADRARILSDFINKLHQSCIQARQEFKLMPTIIWTNQQRANIGTMGSGGPVGSSGYALRHGKTQELEIYSTKINPQEPEGGWKKAVKRLRIMFRIKKNSAAGSSGGEGCIDIHTDDLVTKSLTYKAGTTTEAGMMWDYLQNLGMAGQEEKGGEYHVLHKTFTKVKDIKKYLVRPDINFTLRYLIYAKLMPETARAYLEEENFNYGPFKETQDFFTYVRSEEFSQVGESQEETEPQNEDSGEVKIKKRGRPAKEQADGDKTGE